MFHSNLLGLLVQHGNWITDGNLSHTAAGLFSKSSGSAAAAGRALLLTGGRIRLQAYTLTFSDGFYLVAWMCVALMLIGALLKEAPMKYGQISDAAQSQTGSGEAKA